MFLSIIYMEEGLEGLAFFDILNNHRLAYFRILLDEKHDCMRYNIVYILYIGSTC